MRVKSRQKLVPQIRASFTKDARAWNGRRYAMFTRGPSVSFHFSFCQEMALCILVKAYLPGNTFTLWDIRPTYSMMTVSNSTRQHHVFLMERWYFSTMDRWYFSTMYWSSLKDLRRHPGERDVVLSPCSWGRRPIIFDTEHVTISPIASIASLQIVNCTLPKRKWANGL